MRDYRRTETALRLVGSLGFDLFRVWSNVLRDNYSRQDRISAYRPAKSYDPFELQSGGDKERENSAFSEGILRNESGHGAAAAGARGSPGPHPGRSRVRPGC